MTEAEPDDPIGGTGRSEPAPSFPDPPRAPGAAGDDEGHPLIAWTRAIFGGISDTAKQMLDEGRKGAQEAYDDGWRRFDDKTRFRRTGRR